ncbi:MAG: hypothetical protein AABY16_04945 [Nanoarchaeota archaeon]
MFWKRGIALVLLIFLAFGVFAQDTGGGGDGSDSGPGSDDSGTDDEIDDDEISDDETLEEDGEEDDEEEIDLVEEAVEEHPDAELEVGAGILPNNRILYKVDRFLDRFSDYFKVTEERLAEIEAMVRDENYAAAQIAFDDYKDKVGALIKDIEPGQRDEVRRRMAAVNRILDSVSDEQGEIFEQVLEKELELGTAVEIVSSIVEGCNRLVKIGAFKEAAQVCNLDGDKDDFNYLKERREEWRGEISVEAQEFFEVLSQCMSSVDDGEVNCQCDKMPEVQEEICEEIIDKEKKCDSGDEDSCDAVDEYIEDFMASLTPELREIALRLQEDFEEEEFDRDDDGRPPECRDIEDFRECMLRMAEVHIREAPEPCQDALRAGIRSGEVKGPREGEMICREIMMGEFGDPTCAEEELSPDECAGLMSRGEFRRGPSRGPGVGFSFNCEDFKDDAKILACYRNQGDKIDFTQEYHNEKRESRERGDFDRGEFERRFREDHRGKYADFAGRDHRRGPQRSREEHQEMINRIIAECEEQELPWFCDGGGENPCYCGENYDYGDFSPPDWQGPHEGDWQQGPPPEWRGQPPEGWNPPPGFSPSPGWTPAQGFPPEFVPPEGSLPPEFSPPPAPIPEPAPAPTPSPEPSTTGGVVRGWGSITGNAFLDYYYGF